MAMLHNPTGEYRQIQLVDHFDDKPRQVILRQPAVHWRRQWIRRLPVHRYKLADRSLTAASIFFYFNVPSRVTMTSIRLSDRLPGVAIHERRRAVAACFGIVAASLARCSHFCEHRLVSHEIESWPVDIHADNARLVKLPIEHGPNLRLPHSRVIGKGLFELRPRGQSGIGRASYCFLAGKRVVAVHAFIKKTQQTPERELELARKRVKEIHRD